MSSLLDIGFLFFITLVFGCFSSRKYLRIFLIMVTIIYYLIGSGIIGSFLAKRISTTSTSIKNCIDTEGYYTSWWWGFKNIRWIRTRPSSL
jgi:hypothetical protein